MTKSTESKGALITFMLLMGASLVLAFKMVAPYLTALFIGFILTLVMHPFYRAVRHRGIRPHAAAMIVTICMVVVIVAPFLIFTAIGVRQAISLGQWIMGLEGLSVQDYLVKVSSWAPFEFFSINPEELSKHLGGWLQHIGVTSSNFVLDLAKGIPDGVLQLLLACLTCYCLLTEGGKLSTWVSARIPMDSDIRKRITTSFKGTAISVVVASMAAAATQALMMVFSYLVLGVPNALLAGGATFILAWIPIFGSTPVWVVGAIYLYFQGSLLKVALMIGLGLLTGIADNFVRPLVLKGRGEMHPLVSLVAIFGGIQMFDLFGIFVGPSLAAIVITFLQLWPIVGRRFGLSFAGDEP